MKSFLKIAAAAVAIVAAAPGFGASFLGAGFNIPDGSSNNIGAFASSSISVGSLGAISSIKVTLDNLNHSWAGDIVATLSNGSTTVTLFDRLGVPASIFGSSADFSGSYSFSDLGLFALPENTSNIIAPGIYLPAQALSAFNGLDGAGIWTLTLGDYAYGDVGQLGSWTLDIDYAAGAVPEPATWAMMIGGFALAGAAMRRRSTAVSFA